MSLALSNRSNDAGSPVPLPLAGRGKGRAFPAALGALLLAACSDPQGAPPGAQEEAPAARALQGTLEWAAAGDWRPPEERSRDAALHRVEIARLFGLDAARSVVELGPGAGDWTAVVSPVVAAQGGAYTVAFTPWESDPAEAGLADSFRTRFADPAVFGTIAVAELGDGPVAAPGSVEAAYTVDDVAVWMALGRAEAAFAAAFEVLEPGGRFGVVQPRARVGGGQDPGAASGYVQQAYVVRLAEDAGFALEESSEPLANPLDDTDHPFGVWTLAPLRLTAPLGEAADPSFDRAPYDALGEPDRMVLLFRKPRT